MIALIVQARLSSTRLPNKALLPFGNSCLLDFVLKNLARLKVDKKILACDFESEKDFKNLAKKNSFEIFAGDCKNVLSRFCSCIKHFSLENATIIRATADNPFIFIDIAEKLISAFDDCDYMTFRNLPLGSGVEIFKAKSLLEVQKSKNTDNEK